MHKLRAGFARLEEFLSPIAFVVHAELISLLVATRYRLIRFFAVFVFVHEFCYRRYCRYRNFCLLIQNKYGKLRAALKSGKEFLSQYPKAYWGIQGINFLDCVFMFAYGSISIVFFSDVIGYSDKGAGFVVAALSIVSVFAALVSGPLVDRFGIRKMLYASAALLIFTRAGLGFCGLVELPALIKMSSVFIFGVIGAVPLSMLGAIYQMSNESYTQTEEACKAGYSIWYLIMNLGAVFAGFLVDYIHITLDISWSWILLVGSVISLLNLAVAFAIVRDNGKVIKKSETKASAFEVVFLPMFRRAVSAVVLLIGVRTAFLYLSVLAPKYWYRVIGTEAHVGWLNVINPTIIIIGLIAMIMVKKLRNVDTYKALTYGALVAALCFVPLSVPWYFVSANIVFAYYAMAFASLIILSFGEMFWSPRLSAYILSCATPEQKGMYASFASIPWILANTIAGGFSGIMLLKWAPSTRMWNGAEVPLQTVLATKELPYWQTPEAMWFVLGVIAIVGPIVMLVPKIKKWFTEPEYRFFEPRLAKFITALLFARISTLGYGTREMIFLDRRPQISEVK